MMIDNSITSINGDFYPNRLAAQTLAADRLLASYHKNSAKNQFAVATIGSGNFGIQLSLCKDMIKVSHALDAITIGGEIRFENAIRCGFLALRHRDQEVSIKRIVIFVGSHHDFTQERIEALVRDTNKEAVGVDIIAFGDDVNSPEILESYIKQLTQPSHFIRLQVSKTILSDLVLLSPIGPGDAGDPNIVDDDIQQAINASLQEYADEDEEFRRVLEESRHETENQNYLNSARQYINEYNTADGGADEEMDPELQATLAASRNEAQQNSEPKPAVPAPKAPDMGEDDLNDPELQRALRESLQEAEMNDPELQAILKASMQDAPKENNDDIDMDDPELKAALEASRELPENNNDKIQQELEDPDTLNSILSGLPGVDPNSDLFKKDKKKDDEKDKDKK